MKILKKITNKVLLLRTKSAVRQIVGLKESYQRSLEKIGKKIECLMQQEQNIQATIAELKKISSFLITELKK